MTKSTFIYGLHAVSTALQMFPQQIIQIYLQKGLKNPRLKQIEEIAKNQGVSCQIIDFSQLKSIDPEWRHQGVVAESKQNPDYHESQLEDFIAQLSEPALLLILDQVQDPHNLGACLRTADAAGVHAVIVPKDQSVALTPIVRKVACGAAELIPFFAVTNLARTLKQLQELGIWMYGFADTENQTLYQMDFTGPVGIILGSEGKGMRRLTREHCDYLVKIPMQGSISSLNVSVAAGVSLYEVVRQRNFSPKTGK